MIGFVREEIRFEINLDAAQSEKLKISSKLLALAKDVTDAGAMKMIDGSQVLLSGQLIWMEKQISCCWWREQVVVWGR